MATSACNIISKRKIGEEPRKINSWIGVFMRNGYGEKKAIKAVNECIRYELLVPAGEDEYISTCF